MNKKGTTIWFAAAFGVAGAIYFTCFPRVQGWRFSPSFFTTSVSAVLCWVVAAIPFLLNCRKRSVVIFWLLALACGSTFGIWFRHISEKENIAILSNLRNIGSAGQQYILEHDVRSVGYPKLVEEKYFPGITPIANESYRELTVEMDGGVLSVESRWGAVVYTY